MYLVTSSSSSSSSSSSASTSEIVSALSFSTTALIVAPAKKKQKKIIRNGCENIITKEGETLFIHMEFQKLISDNERTTRQRNDSHNSATKISTKILYLLHLNLTPLHQIR
jgi:hypothetical protein